MKKSVKFLVATVALTAGMLVFSKADSKAAVTGVTQTDGDNSSIGLQWNADLGAESYAIQFSQDGSTWVTVETTSSASDTVYSLTAGSTYYARVGSFSTYSWKIDKTNTPTPASGWSEPVEVVTAPNADGMTLIQTGAATNSITMKSSDVVGANLYQLYTGDFQIGESTTSTIKSSVALNTGTSYDVKCYPCRKAETTGFIAKSGYASKWGVKTLTNKVASSNFGFTNIWYNLNDYKIGIYADSAVGAYDGVQVQLQTPAGKNKRTCSNDGNTVEIRNFNGTFYRYRIRTYVSCGNNKKAYSAWSSYRYAGLSSKISAKANKKSVKLSWSKVKNASGYKVMISTSKESGFKTVKSTKAKTTALTIKKCGKSKIKKHKTYYIRILASTKSGKKTYKSDLINTYEFYIY